MSGTNSVETTSEVGSSAVRRLGAVARVVLKELLLVLERRRDRTGVIDVALRSVDDGDVTETKRNDTTSENVDDVRSLVHEVDLGEDTDRSETFRVNLTSELETVGVSQISVGGGDSQNDRVGLLDELEKHVADLNLDVARLVSNGDLQGGGI